ncbi:MAG: hypothetical protein P4M08_00940 [Oligoflexia bacterium]|nr:hypothetical protein [Oligoflexia bacterium]
MHKAFSARGLVLTSIALVFASCASPPRPKPVSESAKIEFHKTVGNELARKFEPHLAFRQETVVTDYLEKIAHELVANTKGLLLPDITVKLIKNDAWKDYALPGGKIYLSVSTLRQMHYQNEIAAEIALQLAHLQREHVLEYFQKMKASEGSESAPAAAGPAEVLPGQLAPIPEEIDYFGTTGVFAFGEKQDLAALQSAIDILYSAGYDVRGVISLWQVYLNNPQHSPYGDARLTKMLDEARRMIAQKAPLRNPIVRTEAFIAVQKRIKKL